MYLCFLRCNLFLRPVIKLHAYDFTKGGTDVCDQRMASYSIKTKRRKWTLVAFSYILNVTRINTTTVYAMKQGQHPKESFEFGWDLAESLVLPHVQERKMTGLTHATKMKMSLLLRQETDSVSHEHLSTSFAPTQEHRRRCHQCVLEIHGEGYKQRKDTLPRVKLQWQRCGTPCRPKHAVQVCSSCYR